MIKLKNIYQHSHYTIYNIINQDIYCEYTDGFWFKAIDDKNNNNIYFENSLGYYEENEFDENNILLISKILNLDKCL